VTVSAEDARVIGGHLSRATVFTTVEVAVLDTGIPLRREFDPGTGYSELIVPDELSR
jgi:predicted DNA-binding protein with PD1-like motif